MSGPRLDRNGILWIDCFGCGLRFGVPADAFSSASRSDLPTRCPGCIVSRHRAAMNPPDGAAARSLRVPKAPRTSGETATAAAPPGLEIVRSGWLATTVVAALLLGALAGLLAPGGAWAALGVVAVVVAGCAALWALLVRPRALRELNRYRLDRLGRGGW